MPRLLRNLRIDDVSSVDTGAGRGVRVVLFKRYDGDPSFELGKRDAAQARQKLGSNRRRLPTQRADEQDFRTAPVAPEEHEMSDMYCKNCKKGTFGKFCHNCGDEAVEKGARTEFQKQQDAYGRIDTINKLQAERFDLEVRKVKQDNPNLDRRACERIVMNSPAFADIVANDRVAHHGEAYRFRHQ